MDANEGQIIAGEDTLKGILMLDVNPLTLGIETVGGVMVGCCPGFFGVGLTHY